jgi:hypothetical protein
MSISIVNYSEKAIAVFGNTKDIKDHLISLGGKFNPSLKQNDERVAGWVFPNSKKEEVRKIITSFSQGTLGEPPKKVEKASSSVPVESFTISKEMFLALVSRIETLEAELAISKKVIEKLSSVAYIHPVEKGVEKGVEKKPTGGKQSHSAQFSEGKQPTLKFSEDDNLYDDEPQVYKSLFKTK